jgi:tetratricopeptide (TPR) repeat protein
VFDQTRYERAVEAYRLLIELDPNAGDAPDYAGKIVEGYQLLGDTKTAVAEMRKLASDYGPRSPWAAANRDRPNTVAHARTMAEALIRNLAKTMHGEAQQNEKTTKVVDRDRYARAAEAYEFYLANFPDAPDAAELRYLRADILYFKLGKFEDAGASTWRSARRSRSASITRTPCCSRWRRSRRSASRCPRAAPSARSPTATACSARRLISTRRCSPTTKRS